MIDHLAEDTSPAPSCFERGAPPSGSGSITAEREMQLAARIKAGDPQAREELILANLELVRNIASAFRGHNRIIDINDLIQEGNLGLLRAASDFDPEAHGTRFVNYASCWIRYRIRRVLAEQATTIRFPYYLVLLRRQFEKVRQQMIASSDAAATADDSSGPDFEQVVEKMGIEGKRVRFLRSIREQLSSQATTSINEHAHEPALARTNPPQEPLEIAESMDRLYAAMRKLNLIESWVLRRRFRLDESAAKPTGSGRSKSSRAVGPTVPPTSKSDRWRTYRELSNEIGMPPHQLRAIERSAFAKLHEILEPRSGAENFDSTPQNPSDFVIRKTA